MLEAIKNGKNSVWVYRLRKKIVGYGAIGETRRRHPSLSSQYIRLSVITRVALQHKYRGKPKYADRDQRFSGES